jgi:hypothetical protein
VRAEERAAPLTITLPHPDYRPYNKGLNAIVYAPTPSVIYWKDEGDAVLTFKRNGNWYLHGVGGQKFFGREGLTWQLISSTLRMRYLPAGHILDSGAPCAFLRPGVTREELYFILAWCLSPLCNRILKEVINHTRNIQGKDVERLPYPAWVDADRKAHVVREMKRILAEAQAGRIVAPGDADLQAVLTIFEPVSAGSSAAPHATCALTGAPA